MPMPLLDQLLKILPTKFAGVQFLQIIHDGNTFTQNVHVLPRLIFSIPARPELHPVPKISAVCAWICHS
jgi:hypothetical protein